MTLKTSSPSPNDFGTAFSAIWQAVYHRHGQWHAVGGAQALSDALARRLEAWGGTIRTSADVEIQTAVTGINKLLADFETANRQVISATATGRDPNSFIDQRNAILSEIAQYMPISTYTRGNDDMVIMTGDGATL